MFLAKHRHQIRGGGCHFSIPGERFLSTVMQIPYYPVLRKLNTVLRNLNTGIKGSRGGIQGSNSSLKSSPAILDPWILDPDS